MMNGEDISAARKERGKLATAQQRRAANPLKSVWVEASAGRCCLTGFCGCC